MHLEEKQHDIQCYFSATRRIFTSLAREYELLKPNKNHFSHYSGVKVQHLLLIECSQSVSQLLEIISVVTINNV